MRWIKSMMSSPHSCQQLSRTESFDTWLRSSIGIATLVSRGRSRKHQLVIQLRHVWDQSQYICRRNMWSRGLQKKEEENLKLPWSTDRTKTNSRHIYVGKTQRLGVVVHVMICAFKRTSMTHVKMRLHVEGHETTRDPEWDIMTFDFTREQELSALCGLLGANSSSVSPEAIFQLPSTWYTWRTNKVLSFATKVYQAPSVIQCCGDSSLDPQINLCLLVLDYMKRFGLLGKLHTRYRHNKIRYCRIQHGRSAL